jgi:hypothetical protein
MDHGGSGQRGVQTRWTVAEPVKGEYKPDGPLHTGHKKIMDGVGFEVILRILDGFR